MWAREAGRGCRLMGLRVYVEGKGRGEKGWVLVPEPGLKTEKRTQYFMSLKNLKDGQLKVSGNRQNTVRSQIRLRPPATLGP